MDMDGGTCMQLYYIAFCIVMYNIIVLQSFHSFIHSGYFYSASSSPLLLRVAPEIAQIGLLCRSFTPKRHRQLRAQGPYVAARAEVEPTTLRPIDSINEPLRPTTFV